VKFGVTDLHIILSSNLEFCKYWLREGRPFLPGVNNVIFTRVP